MCGICGVVYADRQLPDRGLLEAMNYPLRFRGPDADGFFLAPGVGLGHRRLSVIDLATGGQPMTDPTGHVTIAFNGEIYNFRELRPQLEAAGARFQTTSDTEVLLQGYLHWGPELLPRLAGMFAFALWDARTETLLLARDRLGVKPLSWAERPGGGLVFASELSGVVASAGGGCPWALDPDAVARYLAVGYALGEDSILRGVRRLPPAHTLTWRPGKAPELRCYWNLAEVWSNRPRDRRPLPEIAEEFGALLRTAVRQRMISDVPLGAFLSGGLDSSTVTALMTKESPRVETFSIGFPEASYSELPGARETAEALGTVHFDELVRGDDPGLALEIAERLDEPFADTSLVPTYVLCRMARKRVTVALSGDGGDELLAGYVTHQANRMHRWVSRLPSPLVRTARWAVGLLPDSRRKVNAIFKAKQFLAGAGLDACDAHASWRTVAGPALLDSLLGPALPARGKGPLGPFRKAYGEVPSLNPLDRFLYVDYRTWLLHDILVKADRASMAHGLEVRSPFLDHRLVEFCAGLPPELKLRGKQGKYLLHHFAQGLVPDAVLHRRKAGFNAPVSHWLAGPWRELAADTLSPKRLAADGLLNPDVVDRLLEEHVHGQRDHGYLLFSLLMFRLWVDRVKPARG